MRKGFGLHRAAWFVGAVMLLVLVAACTKEVVKEVPVERIVKEEVVKEVPVEVEKIVEVEKQVVKEVIKEVPVEVVKEVEVIKEVPKVVTEEKVVVKEVEKIVVATPVPAAERGFVLRAVQANPKRGGRAKTAWGATAANFDLHSGGPSWVMGIAYNSLIRKNPNDGLDSVIPSLAVDWEFDPQGLGWTFHLRDGVKWHDGTDFSAEDVKATFDRIINPPEGIVMGPRSLFQTVSNVQAINPLTVRFTLSEPRSWMFDLFNHWGVGTHMNIYSKKSLEENNFDLRKVEIAPGTGPFTLREHLAAERWVWEANPDYWNPELPYVDGVTNLHVPSGEDRGTAVITGIADFPWNTGTSAWNEAKKRSGLGAAKLSNFGTIQTVWNPNKAPFDDIRVRRALFLSI
ncbi:MAG: ABC transporter substrate-binding protein, partial [Dehalococcoidia bacterium]|nr:ABC transporter substrate-binding protein [Dehalococcoidia bacterium]